MAGIVGAAGNNTLGVTGIAWDVSVWATGRGRRGRRSQPRSTLRRWYAGPLPFTERPPAALPQVSLFICKAESITGEFYERAVLDCIALCQAQVRAHWVAAATAVGALLGGDG